MINKYQGSAADERWTTYCDPQLGCLNLTQDWFNLIERPINLLPWPRNKIMTKFSLRTREAPKVRAIVDKR